MRSLIARFTVRRSETFVVDVDLEVGHGETVALLGPNGAGKSSVVAAIAGLLPIDSGRIEIGGLLLDDPAAGVFSPPEVRKIGVVFQDFLLFPHLSVIDNIAFGLTRGRNRAEARSIAGHWAERLAVASLSQQRPGDLSGGEAQRVALARALATTPDVLLLDEPLSALDVTTRAEVRRLLSDHLSEFGGPRLIITHDPTDAYLLADRIYVIENGAITQSGSPDEIRLRPKTRYAADLAGANLHEGSVSDGVVSVDGHPVHVAEEVPDGRVLLAIPATAVSIHTSAPGGSPRNSWSTSVERLEHLGPRARLRTGGPLPLTAELTEAALLDLGIEPGATVWVAIKATEISVEPFE
ncbi:MAG TPA: ATP-binding cassette domain-containing protein [Acidimicrobiia bacterium]|nr:ATP-binding cassette domain-containing protein [Acidimicrobiia bacterium]